MVRPGAIAFPVLLALGAITGFIAYDLMLVKSTPVEGDFTGSPYYKPISESSASGGNSSGSGDNSTAAEVDKSQFADVVTISIPSGASVQGNPDYDPDAATAASDALIIWVNDDTAPHSATSGSGFDDAEYGSLFDSGLLEQGQEFSVPAADLGAGEHPYFCIVHPYMVGTVTVQ